MNVISQLFILALSLFSFNSAYAKDIAGCLKETQNLHRLDRDEKTLACFNKHKAFIGSDNCFQQIRNSKAAKQSQNLQENLKQICFYEASIFQKIDNCMIRAAEFKNAENHDNAIFYCVRQFSEKLNKTKCLSASRSLIYPAKQAHLAQQCDNYQDL